MRNVMGDKMLEYTGKQLKARVMDIVMDAVENAMDTMFDVV